ncbi:LacI family transcriptional regulator [Saccharopolyspora sp. K220]|uniref:LacI family DNA-binding transcriptional regulator n=1 Tax=Saccharopolyspora soli TaxID=2926618 RepID=UPI001F57BFB6|nr:LacI family DNA-binding transcriptional regulator [Saccharopolyspora soli]MCI2422357.1 LacI family transcriptional regulator [Saccharopolyspora soli]
MGKPPTIADVAKLAGVHKATASRALNPRTSNQVTPATARRVLTAAKRLHYQPNNVARSLSTSRSATIGVLIPDLTNPLFPLVLRGIEDALGTHGYTALLANTDDSPERTQAQFDALLSRKVDGFLMATARREDPLLARAHEHGIAVVLINRSTDVPLFPVVTGDDSAGMAAAIEHLTDLGHRRIAHLSGPSTMSTGFGRAQAFRQTAAAHGLPPADTPVVECSSYTEDAGAAAARRLFDENPAVTAILAGNDMIALGALDVLRERGLDCPDDVSLIGFNDMRFVDKLTPPLTTVHVPHHSLGAEAARLLLEQFASADRVPKTVSLPLHLVVRGSTGPARAGR